MILASGLKLVHPKLGVIRVIDKAPPAEGKKFSQVWNCTTESGQTVQIGTSALNRLAADTSTSPIATTAVKDSFDTADGATYSFNQDTIAAHVKQLILCVPDNERMMAARNVQIACDEFLL